MKSEIMKDYRIRNNDNTDAYGTDAYGYSIKFDQKDGYSYVSIPPKEE